MAQNSGHILDQNVNENVLVAVVARCLYTPRFYTTPVSLSSVISLFYVLSLFAYNLLPVPCTAFLYHILSV